MADRINNGIRQIKTYHKRCTVAHLQFLEPIYTVGCTYKLQERFTVRADVSQV